MEPVFLSHPFLRRSVKLPDAFVERMRRLLGDEAEAFFAALQQERAYSLRINPLKIDTGTWQALSPFPLEPVPWCPMGFYYASDIRPGKHPYHMAGLYYIQEPSAMAAVEMLDVRPGEKVLDLAAAPGGKTTQLGAALRGEGLLVANEIHPKRAAVLVENVERFGIWNAVLTNERPERLAERFPSFFDKILVDAPCSGEGMFRKDAEMVMEWSPRTVLHFARIQDAILDEAAKMLKPGGRLVYSTCTFAPEEDEGTVARFLERHPNFELVRHPLAAHFAPGQPRWVDGSPGLADCVRIWPHRVRGEGHFIAVLTKTAENGADWRQSKPSSGGRRPSRRPGSSPVAATRNEAWLLWNELAEQVLHASAPEAADVREAVLPDRFFVRQDQLFLLPVSADHDTLSRLEGLRILRPGLLLGTLKKNRLEPAHALAMALPAKAVKQTVELAAEGEGPLAALRYLRGETLPLDEAGGPAGWLLLTVGGYPLGWGKASGGQIKNHYPKGLRRLWSEEPSIES